jgi:hypothetical protein
MPHCWRHTRIIIVRLNCVPFPTPLVTVFGLRHSARVRPRLVRAAVGQPRGAHSATRDTMASNGLVSSRPHPLRGPATRARHRGARTARHGVTGSSWSWPLPRWFCVFLSVVWDFVPYRRSCEWDITSAPFLISNHAILRFPVVNAMSNAALWCSGSHALTFRTQLPSNARTVLRSHLRRLRATRHRPREWGPYPLPHLTHHPGLSSEQRSQYSRLP